MLAVVLGLSGMEMSSTAASAMDVPAPPASATSPSATSPNASAPSSTASTTPSTPAPTAPAEPTAPATHASNNLAAREPGGYWTGPVNSPVPVTLSGGKVISNARGLHDLLKRNKGTILIDVSNAPRRPDNMAPGAPWLPLPHRAIPGSLWIPEVGTGELPASLDQYFRQKLAAVTDNDLTRPVIIYCHRSCWLSWNAAKRAIGYGYQHVYWYRDGVEGWQAAGFHTAVVEPQPEPPT